MLSDLHRLTADLKEARDQAEEASKIKSAFVSHVSHELRTPLSGIVMALDLLSDIEHGREADELMDVMKISSSSLLGVINQVLDFSRLKEEMENLEMGVVDIRKLVSEIMGLLRISAAKKNITISVEFDPGLPAALYADEEKLRKVCMNLMSNAIKHTEYGLVKINVKVLSRSAGSTTIRFEVLDEGKGIPLEDQKHLFEEFWSKKNSANSAEASSGLGLNIAKSLVELMDGQLGMYNREDRTGSVFWFMVPLDLANVEVPEATPQAPIVSANRFSGRVLIVDDNEINRKIGSMMLHKLGLETRDADSGKAALDLLATHDFDLVLMDVHMPAMSGLDTLREIRKTKSASVLPVLAWTANASIEDQAKYRDAGMRDVVQKPINVQELHKVLENVLL